MRSAVEFRRLSKSFEGVQANGEVCLKVWQGSIHAIIGENGAGKSTAMKILFGMVSPDSGEIFIDDKLWGGKMKPWANTREAIECGIGMVHQHFMLGGPHTVLDNIVLGVEQSTPWWRWLPYFLRPIDRQGARKKLEKISDQYGLHVDLDARVEDLSVGFQQRIEILKLLYRDAKILILDEPTAVLTPQETLEFFENLKRLVSVGKTVLIITHKLKEVMSIASRVTVFRAGRVVGEREIGETSIEELATLMVGRKVNLMPKIPPQPQISPADSERPVMEIKDVCVEGHRPLRNLNLQIRPGEIVGISGVEGNGQSELLQLLLFPLKYSHHMTGQMKVLGKDIRRMTTHQIKALGMGVIPDDRLKEALLLERPVQDNFILGIQRRAPFFQHGLISKKKVAEATQLALEEYDIRPRSTEIHSARLSGGNQQKLVIAREFKYSPRFLIAAQPTRGVDIGAIEFIHKRILKAREEGSGVLLISSELDEVLALSDRILVMYEGKIVAEFKRGEVTERVLGLRLGGEVST